MGYISRLAGKVERRETSGREADEALVVEIDRFRALNLREHGRRGLGDERGDIG
jgi:hypothetical protein